MTSFAKVKGSVLEVLLFEPWLELRLVIISGACQALYESSMRCASHIGPKPEAHDPRTAAALLRRGMKVLDVSDGSGSTAQGDVSEGGAQPCRWAGKRSGWSWDLGRGIQALARMRNGPGRRLGQFQKVLIGLGTDRGKAER